MSDTPGMNNPPDWYTKPPQWLTDGPPRRGRYRDDDDDDYRPRRRDRDRDYDNMRDLEQRIAGMPEAVVNALKEAIQGATQERQAAQNSGTPQPPEQKQETSNSSTDNGKGGDDKPAEQLSWGERFLMNKL